MIDVTLRRADERTIRRLDAFAGIWVVLWLVVGGWFGYSMWQLASLGDTVSASGGVVESVGGALEALAGVPVIGEEPAELGAEVTVAGTEVTARGQEIKGQLRQIAVLLGSAIAIMPLTLIAALYLPLRLARRRELAALRAALDDVGLHPTLERYLADQATRTLPFATLHRLGGLNAPPDTRHPGATATAPSVRQLADAELSRLGVHHHRP